MIGIILYDGICNLCLGVISFIQKHDTRRRFRYVTLQSAEGRKLSEVVTYEEVDLHSVKYIAGEKAYFRSTAVLHILKDMGGLWKLFYGFIIIPPVIRDFIYNLVSRTRYLIFGKPL